MNPTDLEAKALCWDCPVPVHFFPRDCDNLVTGGTCCKAKTSILERFQPNFPVETKGR